MHSQIALLRGGLDDDARVFTVEDEMRGSQRLVVGRNNAIFLNDRQLREAVAETILETYVRGGDFMACSDAVMRRIASWGHAVERPE